MTSPYDVTINVHAGWGWALAVDPTADETSSATPGVPGEPGFFDDTGAAALAPDIVDLSNVTVSNDTPINVTSGHPLFAFNGQALGTVFSGTPVADNVTGTGGVDVFVTRGGNRSQLRAPFPSLGTRSTFTSSLRSVTRRGSWVSTACRAIRTSSLTR